MKKKGKKGREPTINVMKISTRELACQKKLKLLKKKRRLNHSVERSKGKYVERVDQEYSRQIHNTIKNTRCLDEEM